MENANSVHLAVVSSLRRWINLGTAPHVPPKRPSATVEPTLDPNRDTGEKAIRLESSSSVFTSQPA